MTIETVIPGANMTERGIVLAVTIIKNKQRITEYLEATGKLEAFCEEFGPLIQKFPSKWTASTATDATQAVFDLLERYGVVAFLMEHGLVASGYRGVRRGASPAMVEALQWQMAQVAEAFARV